MLWCSGAIRLSVIFHLLGPGLFFHLLAYWLANPRDWIGPLSSSPLSLILTLTTPIIVERPK